MSAVASQISSLTIVYSTVYSAQMASNAENVSIWWRHNEKYRLTGGQIHCWCNKVVIESHNVKDHGLLQYIISLGKTS